MASINVNTGFTGTPTSASFQLTGNTDISCAGGVSDTTGLFQLQVKSPRTFPLTTIKPANLDNVGPFQITIDPSTNGNITLNPNGIGVTSLTTNLTLPTSNTALTQGIITIGAGNRWISAIGTQNTFVGQGSGSTSITSAQENVGIGTSALGLLTSGSNNSCIGWGSGIKMTSAGDNVSIGAGSLNNLLTGNFNIALGTNSGNQYKGAETYNILLGSTGVTGDSGVMRLGNSQTVSTYLAGAYGNAPASSQFLTVNSSGQLGSTAGGGGGASTFNADSGSATESGGAINIYGDGQAINTAGSGSTVTISIDQNPVVSGYLTTGNGLVINGGAISIVGSDQVGNGIIYADGMPAVLWDDVAGNQMFGQGAGNYGNLTGSFNHGIGYTTLPFITSGSYNTAVGAGALAVSTGSNNTAIGFQAGSGYGAAETNNISIGYNVLGGANESNTIRIGNSSNAACYITGISGVTVTGSAVLCSATGQLGTVASSRRYKDGIKDMGKDSHNLMGLRPVTFHYKSDPAKTKSYGLIAEEVQELMPSLVILDEEGKPESVKYHEMPAILLNELQKALKRIEELEKKLL